MEIAPEIVVEVERSLVRARGHEVGGLLFEDQTGKQLIRLAPNLMSEPGAFEAPAWWFETMLGRSDAHGCVPVAFFHSHISGFELSETDRASMERLPLPWIVFCREGGAMGWRVYYP